MVWAAWIERRGFGAAGSLVLRIRLAGLDVSAIFLLWKRDCSGLLVIILGTKFLYEIGSREGKPFQSTDIRNPVLRFLAEHSLLLTTGLMALAALAWTRKAIAARRWGIFSPKRCNGRIGLPDQEARQSGLEGVRASREHAIICCERCPPQSRRRLFFEPAFPPGDETGGSQGEQTE